MDDFTDFNASCRFQFVAGNGRALASIEYLSIDIEALQRFLKDTGIFPDFVTQADGVLRSRFEHAHRRQPIRHFASRFGYGTAPFFTGFDSNAALFDFNGFEIVHVMAEDIRFPCQRSRRAGLYVMSRWHRITDDRFMDLAVRRSIFRYFLNLFPGLFIRVVASPIVRHVFFDGAGIEADFFDAVSQVAGVGYGRRWMVQIYGIPTSGPLFRDGPYRNGRSLGFFRLQIEDAAAFVPLFQGLRRILKAFDSLARHFGRFLAGLISYDSHRFRNRPIFPDQESDDTGTGNSHDSSKKSKKPSQGRGHDGPDDASANR